MLCVCGQCTLILTLKEYGKWIVTCTLACTCKHSWFQATESHLHTSSVASAVSFWTLTISVSLNLQAQKKPSQQKVKKVEMPNQSHRFPFVSQIYSYLMLMLYLLMQGLDNKRLCWSFPAFFLTFSVQQMTTLPVENSCIIFYIQIRAKIEEMFKHKPATSFHDNLLKCGFEPRFAKQVNGDRNGNHQHPKCNHKGDCGGLMTFHGLILWKAEAGILTNFHIPLNSV